MSMNNLECYRNYSVLVGHIHGFVKPALLRTLSARVHFNDVEGTEPQYGETPKLRWRYGKERHLQIPSFTLVG